MPSSDLDFRFDFAAAPEGRAEIARLIQDMFAVDVTPLDRLGHDPSVVSFGWWRGPELIANVSLYQRELWLQGDRVEAFGVQSVAVRPAWRGRGLFRDLMAKALAHADVRAGLVVLTTGTPGLYTPFGFRQVCETIFSGPLEPGRAPAKHRRLSLASDRDVALVRDLFARRTPVSRVCSACDHPALFFLKAMEDPDVALMHLPDFDALAAIRSTSGPALILLDVVAPAIPPLEGIAAALGGGFASARVFITPDRLAWNPAQTTSEDTGYMVRGPYMPEGHAFMLSPMKV